MNHKEDLIAGRNAVIEALRAKKPIDKIFVLDGCQDGPIRTIVREAKKTDAILKFVDKERLNQLTNEHHQGVVAIVAAYEYGTIDDLFKRAEEKGEDPFFILLDGIEDPHNLGAIIRTANLAGAHGVIIPKHRAVGITPTVAKTSAGAINYTPVVKVTNITKMAVKRRVGFRIDPSREPGRWKRAGNRGLKMVSEPRGRSARVLSLRRERPLQRPVVALQNAAAVRLSL